MAVVDVHRFAESITCHAWSPDHSMVAFCPNNNEVHIYKSSQDQWERLHVLEKIGVRSPTKIVTVSHDRNSYVWSLEGGEWVPTLVILRLTVLHYVSNGVQKRTSLLLEVVRAKTVCICYLTSQEENNWWVSKLIPKRHESSVTNVAWHPR
ncbi:Actin-related protein 2/3 complex subunit 1B [Raphanus sativus]|nr:Actin-related protein 2/3 complex subunit 1B [Raphanus sativus]